MKQNIAESGENQFQDYEDFCNKNAPELMKNTEK